MMTGIIDITLLSLLFHQTISQGGVMSDVHITLCY